MTRRGGLRGLVALSICVVSSLPLLAEPLKLDRVEHLDIADGLAHSTVWEVEQDDQGFLWFLTAAFVQRYDGYRFKDFKHDLDDPESLSASESLELYVDPDGALWFATRGEGLNRYDRELDRFVRYRHDPDDATSLGTDSVFRMFQDPNGALWLGTAVGLERLDPETGTFEHWRHDPEDPSSLGEGGVLGLLVDRQGNLWASSGGQLSLYDPERNAFTHFRGVEGEPDLDLGVTSIVEDPRGNLWMGDDSGLLVFDREQQRMFRYPGTTFREPIRDVTSIFLDSRGDLWVTTHGAGLHRASLDRDIIDAGGELTTYRHRGDDPYGLSSDFLFSVIEDRSGVFWVTGRAGVDKIDPRREVFEVWRSGGENGLLGSRVWGLAEDQAGKLWVGTHDGGLTAFDRERGTTRQYRPREGVEDSLPSTSVTAVLVDRGGDLWLGTGDAGLARLEQARGERFISYRHDPDDPHSLHSDYVYTLLEDQGGDLWIATLGTGLGRWDRDTGRFRSYQHDPEDPTSLAGDDAYGLFEDRQGTLWVATYGGLSRFDRGSDSFESFRHDPDDPNSFGDNYLTSIAEDADGILWVGSSNGGLNRFDRQSGEVRRYREKDGLPSDGVMGVLTDDDGYIWLATDRGLSRFDPRTETFRNFDADDGLHGRIFYIGPTLRTARGEIILGGAGGVTAFFPEKVALDSPPPPVELTELLLLNEPAALAHRDPSSPLSRPISESREIVLDHRQKIFALAFTALDFTSPAKTRYTYRLDGFDDDWIATDALHRIAQYTNLDAGRYTFEVKAAGKDGDWGEPRALEIRVLPPLWRSWWAYTLYALALAGAVLAYVRFQQHRLETERRIAERERTANQRLREADRLKDEFLANTSHELRTPLYGITGLAESMLDEAGDELKGETRNHLSMIVASGRRLSHLVNDILDFSKLRHQSLELDLRAVDLHAMVDVVLALSRPLIGNKDVTLINGVPEGLTPARADENRLQQILHNLVGNAVKFTEEGRVEVAAELDAPARQIIVRVQDTGIGIPEDGLAKIFDAFEQVDASIERQHGGTGLGLAVSRQLVELHGGTINVDSAEGEGSTFSFTLPVADDEVTTQISSPIPEAMDAKPQTRPEVLQAPAAGSAAILVVDDEPVNRQVLTSQLRAAGYGVQGAADGAEALLHVEEDRPDLILLDVMMPRMSGYEVCQKLRATYSLDELPIIFLTAKSQPSDLVVGLAAGANDYLPKPISKSELLARVETHLALLSVHGKLSRLVEERTNQVAERERLISERERLIGKLEERNAELARFNYTVAHDLKNPLITIKNFLGLARRDMNAGQTERAQEDLDRLDNAADRLQSLLDDLAELSRIGIAPETPQEVALNHVVQRAVDHFARRFEELGVTLEIAADLPTILGEGERLEALFRQLLDNASRYLGYPDEPRIEIGTRHDKKGQNGEATVIFVKDNGVGIEPRYQEKIFGLFERLDPKTEGTGVGLALARRIVEVHGGRIWVESEGVGEGTTFCLTLPGYEV